MSIVFEKNFFLFFVFYDKIALVIKMKYKNIKKGIFLDRPNRFISNVEIDGKAEVVHVKNTGRCRELLIPGVTVYVQEFENTSRKTKFDLIAVCKGKELFNIDSQAPNKVFGEWVLKSKYFGDADVIKAECRYGDSRFDFYIEAQGRKIFVEVKGVTLEEDGVLMFPDAPTERGVKHINELCNCMDEGYEAYVFFVVQAEKAKYFTPNRRTHPAFADALKIAKDKGVNILCVNCRVTEDSLEINEFVDVKI